MITIKYIKSKIKIFYLLIILSNISFSQNELFNNGSSIAVQTGGLIFVQGEVVNTDNGSNIGLIANSGSITLAGDWTNNSISTALTPTVGNVLLNGALQLIKGAQPTTFNNLTLLGSNTKRLMINTFVGGITGVLNLTARPLDLNSNTLFVTNALPAAITRTSGYIISETPALPGYGTIDWRLANNIGNYEFPFGTATASYIPYYYTVASAGAQSGIGSVSASTYPTNPAVAINNRPLPTGVNNLINNCNTEHAIKMVDRFWVINANNYSTLPTVITKFTYLDDEWNTNAGSTNIIIEPTLNTWHYNLGVWTPIAGTNNSTLNEQTVTTNTNYGMFTLGEYRQLSINLVNIDSVKCFGENNGVIQFSSTVGYDVNSYNWNSTISSDTIKVNLLAGTYTIIATDAMGCSDTLNNLTVYEPTLLSQNLIANDYSICRNQSILLTANYTGGTQPYILNWSTGSSVTNLSNSSSSLSLTPITNTFYISTLTDKNNCIKKDTVFVNVNQLPIVNFTSNVIAGCQPLLVNFINLSNSNPIISSNQWYFSQGSTSNLTNPSVVFNSSGVYPITLVAQSDSGCVNSIVKNNYITVYEKPIANFEYSPSNDADILNPKIEFFNTSTGNYTSSDWTFGDGNLSSLTNPTHTFFDIGFFNTTLIVSTKNNCVDFITKIVEIKDAPVVYIPNTFTPLNTDGLNDIFTAKGVNFYDFKLLIFDRWGIKIAETNDALQGWNGKYKGQDCQAGTYVYQISLKFSNGFQKGISKTYTGHINLLN